MIPPPDPHDEPLRVLWVQAEAGAAEAPAGPVQARGFSRIEIVPIDSLQAWAERSARADAAVFSLGDRPVTQLLDWPAFAAACSEFAVLVRVPAIDEAEALRLLETGVQDVIVHADAVSLASRTVLAIARKRLEFDAAKARATDLMTGLPDRRQLIEHMSQMLALREREPAPVGVLAFRIDGLPAVQQAHGLEAANVIRRKVAVRLRAGVRASDVVAAIGPDVFGIFLPSTESPADAQRVAAKLVQSLRGPFRVAGSSVAISARVGIAQFPQDGDQPAALLRHASAAAMAAVEPRGEAAND
ncbi:MAG: GGDEF domain-containing protein [Burkholderiaceae bacterium]